MHCIQCAYSELETGALYHEKLATKYSGIANEENSDRLWKISEKLLKQ
jgi:hypothetical protein